MIRFLMVFLASMLFLLPLPGHCAQLRENPGSMELVSARDGFANCWQLFDGNEHEAIFVEQGSSLTLRSSQGFSCLYLIFDEVPQPYTIIAEDTGELCSGGEQGFLHDFADLSALFGYHPRTVTISFPQGDARLCELYPFPPGAVPDFVQRWRPPKEGQTDLILFSTHADDEQLFFAGLLPLYAGERQYEVLVAYLTDHGNHTSLRRHELLEGLWAVGVKTYPILGPFPDHYSQSMERAIALHRQEGLSQEKLLDYVVTLLRKYRPRVAVGHDVNGEYGHGQHMLYARLLQQGVDAAADPAQFPDSAARWGTWDTPKTYLHLWPGNPVTMNYDQPLKRFQGMTAFQVTQKLGFPCHQSQYWGFAWYIAGYEHACDIPKYSPCQFGLYRTTVGPDRQKDDLFENVLPCRTTQALHRAEAQERAALQHLRASLCEILSLLPREKK